MNKREQLQFIHKCAVLLEAGIPLGETLSMLVAQEKSKKRQQVIIKINDNVKRGMSLSKSISQVTSFDASLLSLITFGENSGILALSLRQAYSMLENGNAIRKKLTGALVYPAFIAIATVGMTLFLVMYIFPKIVPLFSTMNIELPLLTRLVQKTYYILSEYGLMGMGIGLVLLLCFVYALKKRQKFRRSVHRFVLTLPIFNELIKKYYVSQFTQSIGTLLECGQTLTRILEQLPNATRNEVYKEAWWKVGEKNARGVSLSQALRDHPLCFPSIGIDLIAVGERSGTLATMLLHVHSMYERELDDYIKRFGSLIEPVLMVGMGLVVGSVALSIILPIYEITNHLQH